MKKEENLDKARDIGNVRRVTGGARRVAEVDAMLMTVTRRWTKLMPSSSEVENSRHDDDDDSTKMQLLFGHYSSYFVSLNRFLSLL